MTEEMGLHHPAAPVLEKGRESWRLRVFKYASLMLFCEVSCMPEVVVKIPDELKGLGSAAGFRWQLAIESRLMEEFEELARARRILEKSKLTEKQAESLADEADLSLAKRYGKLLKDKPAKEK